MIFILNVTKINLYSYHHLIIIVLRISCSVGNEKGRGFLRAFVKYLKEQYMHGSVVEIFGWAQKLAMVSCANNGIIKCALRIHVHH